MDDLVKKGCFPVNQSSKNISCKGGEEANYQKCIHSITKQFSPIVLCACCLLFFPVTAAWSFQTIYDDISVDVRGFGTAGVVFSDSDTVGFRRDTSQSTGAKRGAPDIFTDSLLGIQCNAKYKTKVEVVGQLLGKKQLDTEPEDFLSMLFVGFTPSPELTLRAGRLPFDIFPLSEFRHVGYANLWIRPVAEFYGIMPLEYFHGFDFSYRHLVRHGLLEFRLGTGYFDVSTYYEKPDTVTNSSFRSFWDANITYQYHPWKIRLGYMRATFDKMNNIFFERMDNAVAAKFVEETQRNPALRELLNDTTLENSPVDHFSFGLTYDNDNWIISGELGHLHYHKIREFSHTAGYFSVGYRVKNFTPYIAVSKIDTSQKKDQEFEDISAIPPQLLNFDKVMVCDQESYSLGCRWDFHSNMACTLQWSHHLLDEQGSILWLRDVFQQREERVNTFSFAFDFIF